MKFLLAYETSGGDRHFKTQVTVHEGEMKQVVKDFVNQYHPAARKLVDKWFISGEDVTMYPICEALNGFKVVASRLEMVMESHDDFLYDVELTNVK